jgi:site-specific recombinase XerD
MTTELTTTTTDQRQAVVDLVIDGLTSTNSKRAYRKALLDFLAWHDELGRPPLTKALVNAYRTHLMAQGLAPSSVNLRLSAVRKLAVEAADNGLLDGAVANGIGKVKGVKTAGVRAGNWLPKEAAQALLALPDTSTVKGLRDRAILAILLGCGLRRSEVSGLTVEHIAQRDGRWVIVDLVGKGGRVRTVPMPSWAKAALDAWTGAAGITSGTLFRSMRRGDHVEGANMTDQAIADVVRAYAAQAGVELAAHDARRTFAKLAHKGGAPIEQIQLTLGHASVKTTERYLGVEQDLTNAPCDVLGLRLE